MNRLTSRILDISNDFYNKTFSFTKDYVSVHHPIIWTGLKIITPMLLSINTNVNFVFNALMGFIGKNKPDKHGI